MQLPAPVIAIVAPFVLPLVQLSVAPTENVTGFPEAPPVALTVNGASPNVLFANAANEIVWLALFTVSWADPLFDANEASPANEAATPVG